MPVYDYHCTACGADSEILHKISDPPETVCPECGKTKLIKQVSAAGFRLSGGGWYDTAFKSGGKKKLDGEKGGDKRDRKSVVGGQVVSMSVVMRGASILKKK